MNCVIEYGWILGYVCYRFVELVQVQIVCVDIVDVNVFDGWL